MEEGIMRGERGDSQKENEQEEVKEDYERRVCERLNEARLAIRERTGMNDMFRAFKDATIIQWQQNRLDAEYVRIREGEMHGVQLR